MQYYERLRAIREDRDMTQRQVADILKMKQQQYSNYERGFRAMPLDILTTLCRYYGVSADYILGLPEGLEFPKR